MTSTMHSNDSNARKQHHQRAGVRQIAAGGLTLLAIAAGRGAMAADFNGDGFEDLAIGVPFEDIGGGPIIDAGCVNVIYGSPTGLQSTLASGAPIVNQLWHQNRPGMKGIAKSGDRFGEALATGDFNADGFDDLAIGIPGKTIGGAANAGQVHILYGSATGLTAAGDLLIDQTMFGDLREAGDLFGAALGAGDINGDGTADLVIGAPGEDFGVPRQGVVCAAYGAAGGGFFLMGPPIIDQPMLGDPPLPGDQFGWSIAVGDFDVDGLADVAVGAPFDDLFGGIPDAGIVHVMHGATAGLLSSGVWFFIEQGMLADPPEPGDLFGYSLAAGDVNGDVAADLGIGVPMEDLFAVDHGMVHVVMALPGIGLHMPWSIAIIQETFGTGVSQAGDLFGTALVMRDYEGDLFADLTIGAPGETIAGGPGAGEVTVLPGGPGGVATGATPVSTWNQDTPGIREVAAAGDRFGIALAGGDFDGDGRHELVIGVPGEEVGGAASGVDAGCINLIPGSGGGLTPAGDRIWHQNTPGVKEAKGAGDGFGYALGN